MKDLTSNQKIIQLDWDYIANGLFGALFWAVVVLVFLGFIFYLAKIGIPLPIRWLTGLLGRLNPDLSPWEIVLFRFTPAFACIYFFPFVSAIGYYMLYKRYKPSQKPSKVQEIPIPFFLKLKMVTC